MTCRYLDRFAKWAHVAFFAVLHRSPPVPQIAESHFSLVLYIVGVTWFSLLTAVLTLCYALAFLRCVLFRVLSKVASLVVRETVMAHVRSITCRRDDVPMVEGEGVIIEKGAIDEGYDNAGPVEIIKSVHASDAGSDNSAEGDSDEGSRTYSYYFGPSMVTITRIREMIDHGYFAEGGAHASGKDTIPEPDSDEAAVFEVFFYRWLDDASTPSSCRYIVKVSGAAPSAYPQCHWAAVEIYLGGG
jgi:hypothetical protein